MNTLRLPRRIGRKLLIFALASAGLVGVIASIAWVGCATSPANNQPSRTAPSWTDPPYDSPPEGVRYASAPKVDRFKDNVIFLKEANVQVSEVYASFGPADWESTPLRLIAYRARNHQVLFVTYGTNSFVTRFAVQKNNPTESLAEAATKWLRTN